MIALAEELRNAILVYQLLHTDGQLLGVTHLTGLIQHAHDELLVAWCGDHRSILVLLILFSFGES